MNFSPAHKALSSVNGMQKLLMMYFEAYCPKGTDSNPAYTQEVRPGKMCLQTEGCVVNYVKCVGGLSQDLS